MSNHKFPVVDAELACDADGEIASNAAAGASKVVAADAKDEAQLLQEKEKRAKLRARLLADDDAAANEQSAANAANTADEQLLQSLTLPPRPDDADSPSHAPAPGKAGHPQLHSPIAERSVAALLSLNARSALVPMAEPVRFVPLE